MSRRSLFVSLPITIIVASCSGSSPVAENGSSGGYATNNSGGATASSSGGQGLGGAATPIGGSPTGSQVFSGGAPTSGGSRAGGSPGSGGANTGGSTATGGKSVGSAGSGGATVTATGGVAAGGSTKGGMPAVGGSPSACKFPAPAGSPVAKYGQLSVVGTRVQDQAGNPVQLKGISSFWLNWESKRYAESKAALAYVRDNWKLSVFRASMGIDASGGYLTSATAKSSLQQRMDQIVQNALDIGIYVLIDWHTERAVDQQAESIEFFTGMAEKYGACPNVIYEDYNEPTGVTWAQIKPYHQAVVNAIRAKDPDNLIVMGTPNWSQDVDVAAQSPASGANLLYTLHFYSCSHGAGLRSKATTAISRGAALFVTEFGATPANGGVSPNNTICEAEATNWFTWMAQNGVGGVSWKLGAGTDSSNLLLAAAPVEGPWTDSVLTTTNGSPRGHGLFVVNWIRQ